MKAYQSLYILLGLLLGSLPGSGQRFQQPYALQLRAHNSTSGSDFRVNITRGPHTILLRYGRLDSLQNKRLHADPRYAAYFDVGSLSQQSATEQRAAARRFLAWFEQYKVYRWDSLQVSTKQAQPFCQLLDSVYTSSAAYLERHEENRNRLVLDGTSVELLVKTDSSPVKEISVYAPDPVSHPLLYRLLHEALQRYRQASPTSFLDQRYTRGY